MSQHNPVPFESDDGLPYGCDSVHAAPLSHTDLASLRKSLAHQLHRRRAYRAGPLLVSWDGTNQRTVRLQAGGGGPFRIPLTASCLDVFGEDAEGSLLLATCPLPGPDVGADEVGSHWSVTLEGGQTLTVEVALDYGREGRACAYVVQIAFTDAATEALQDAEALVVEIIPVEPRPERSASDDPPRAASVSPEDRAEALLLAEIRGLEIQAKAL
jgi:hypothetical protein